MDTMIVVLIVGTAVGYIGWKIWGMVKPGHKATGCGCSESKGGCSGCPLVKP